MGYKVWTNAKQNDFYFLKEMGLKPEHRFLDVGCGGGRMGKSLIGYLNSSNYYAFDKEKKYIDNFLKSLNSEKKYSSKNPTILRSDFKALNFDKSTAFDFVYAYSVFTHLAPDSITDFLSKLSSNFTDGSLFATVCFTPRKHELDTSLDYDYKIMGGKHERPGEYVEVFYDKDYFRALLKSSGYKFTHIDNFSGYIGPGKARVNVKDKPVYFGRWANIESFQQMIRITKI